MPDNLMNKSILLVDDDSDFLQVLASRCQSIGLEVRTARNLLTAMMQVSEQIPDLLCIDVEMPSGNGLSFCRMLAENPETAEVCVMVLTGRNDQETKQRCQQLGAQHICKAADTWNVLESHIRSLSQCKQRMDSPLLDSQADTNGKHRGMPYIEFDERNLLPTQRTVVILEDDVDLSRLLIQRFSQLGFTVISTDNVHEAMNSINALVPSLVCLDVDLPIGNGLSVCEMMSQNQRLSSIPMVVMTGHSSAETIRRCHQMAAFYVEKGSDAWGRIEPVVRELFEYLPTIDPPPEESTKVPSTLPGHKAEALSDDLLDVIFEMLGENPEALNVQSETAPDTPVDSTVEQDLPWVLCIDDDADFSEAVKLRLESMGVAVVRAFDGREGYRKAFMHPASAILLDYEMPNGQGDYVLRRLKENPVTSEIPVIVVTGVKDKMVERTMLNLGAQAFLTKPVGSQEIRAELSKHINILQDCDEPVLLG